MSEQHPDDLPPHRIPVEERIDLHPFRPSEVASVVKEYLDEASRAGFSQVRLIHGKGKGAQRATVAAALSRHPMVDSFFPAPPEAGGWGATIALLRGAAAVGETGGGAGAGGPETDAARGVGRRAARDPASGVRPGRVRVLFLCTANACRSQMAEGWARALRSDTIEAHSAGVAPCYLHPLAERVMREAGVDISHQYSKSVDEFEDAEFDYVVTLCGYAESECPLFPGHGVRIHHPFEDPVRVRGTEAEVLAAFRATRDAIREFVEGMPENLLVD